MINDLTPEYEAFARTVTNAPHGAPIVLLPNFANALLKESRRTIDKLELVLTDSSLRAGEKTAICRGIIFDYEAQRKELL